jgi:hypothetical protein
MFAHGPVGRVLATFVQLFPLFVIAPLGIVEQGVDED